MNQRGNCYDNAVAESCFGTYNSGLLAEQPQGRFSSKAQARALTADYIEAFYSWVWRRSTLGYKSPVAFELVQQSR